MANVLSDLEGVLRDRRESRPSGSYSVGLLDDRDLLQRKVMEEAFEFCLEVSRSEIDRSRVVSEAADLLFHTVVGLVAADVGIDEVLDELDRRRR
jgi:phosphoribosyl-ATP pyrophosphohydrolase